MMQMMQEMLEAQQEHLMRTEAVLQGWTDRLVARETVVNERLVWLWDQVNAMNVDEEEEDTLGAEGVLPGRQIESFLRVFKQFTLNLPRG